MFLAIVPFISLLQDVVAALVKDFPDDDALREELRAQVRNSEAMAVAMFHAGASSLPDPPPADRPVNPYAVGLDPDSWEADGLYDSPGLTLEQARPGSTPTGGPAPAGAR
jgi:hypothetical protein